MSENLLTRTWNGVKPFDYVDPETKERRSVEKGETIKVKPQTVKAFSANFIDPDVAKAKKAADDAEQKANEEAESGAKKEDAPEPKNPAGPGQSKSQSQ